MSSKETSVSWENYEAEVRVAEPELLLLKPIVLCDLDGTLADCTHRLHYITGKLHRHKDTDGTENWKEFFAHVKDDTPIEPVCQWVRNLPPDYEVYIVSGRSDECKNDCIWWLVEHRIPFQQLFMRKEHDHRPDDIVKEEILLQYMDKDRIAFVIDDRQRVVDMWRRHGLTVYQVADGDF